MADASITMRLALRGFAKLARQFEDIGRAVKRATRALRGMPTVLDMVYYRAVDRADRRSRAARPPRRRHGRQHRTRA